MMSARLTILHRHVVPRAVNAVFQQQHAALLPVFNSGTKVTFQNPVFVGVQSLRCISTAPAAVDISEIRGMVSDGKSTIHETKQKTPGHVTRSLRVLDMDVVRKILEELKAVDVNADGR
jgi:hypothetical protein